MLQTAMDDTDKKCGSISLFSLTSEADLEALTDKIVGTSLDHIFEVVSLFSSYISRLQASVGDAILEDLEPQSLRDKCAESLENFIALLESSVAQALTFGISNCLQVFGKVMKARQIRTDFCPRDDDMDMGGLGKVTPACTIAVQCISAVHRLCVTQLGGPNIVPFMNGFGDNVFQALRIHFGSFTYNPQGALRLKRDLAEYADIFKIVGADGVSKSFDELSEQANLLVVMPESISDLVKEDLKIGESTVQFWVKMREDYKSAKIEQLLAAELDNRKSL
mmetsp:Transcript_5441/g.13607  ORF Transcript_5441/g.13607 Transcript_5441/m.13607 type:complete len:279 (-) Transcript_5441:93-929(-)